VYDTSESTGDVDFGSASDEEMCQDFIYYYPRLFSGQAEDGTDQFFNFCGYFGGSSICGNLDNDGFEIQ